MNAEWCWLADGKKLWLRVLHYSSFGSEMVSYQLTVKHIFYPLYSAVDDQLNLLCIHTFVMLFIPCKYYQVMGPPRNFHLHYSFFEFQLYFHFITKMLSIMQHFSLESFGHWCSRVGEVKWYKVSIAHLRFHSRSDCQSGSSGPEPLEILIVDSVVLSKNSSWLVMTAVLASKTVAIVIH